MSTIYPGHHDEINTIQKCQISDTGNPTSHSTGLKRAVAECASESETKHVKLDGVRTELLPFSSPVLSQPQKQAQESYTRPARRSYQQGSDTRGRNTTQVGRCFRSKAYGLGRVVSFSRARHSCKSVDDGHSVPKIAQTSKTTDIMREVQQEDLLLSRGANPRTGMISPDKLSIDEKIEQDDVRPTRGRCTSSKWQQKGDQWVSTKNSNTPYGPRHQVLPPRNQQRPALRVPPKLGKPSICTSNTLIQSHSMYTFNDQTPLPRSTRHINGSIHPRERSRLDRSDYIHINDAQTKRRPVGTPDRTALAPELDLEGLKPRPLAISTARSGSGLRSSSAPTPRKHQFGRQDFDKNLPRLPSLVDNLTLYAENAMASGTSQMSIQASGRHQRGELLRARQPSIPIKDKQLPDLPNIYRYVKAGAEARASVTDSAPVQSDRFAGATNSKLPYNSQELSQACLHPSPASTNGETEKLKVWSPFIPGKETIELAGTPRYDNPPKFSIQSQTAQSNDSSGFLQAQVFDGLGEADASKLTTDFSMQSVPRDDVVVARPAHRVTALQSGSQETLSPHPVQLVERCDPKSLPCSAQTLGAQFSKAAHQDVQASPSEIHSSSTFNQDLERAGRSLGKITYHEDRILRKLPRFDGRARHGQQVQNRKFQYPLGTVQSMPNQQAVVPSLLTQNNDGGAHVNDLNVPKLGIERQCSRCRGGFVAVTRNTTSDNSRRLDPIQSPSIVDNAGGSSATLATEYSMGAADSILPQKEGMALPDLCSSNDRPFEDHETSPLSTRHILAATIPSRCSDESAFLRQHAQFLSNTELIHHTSCCLECCQNGCHGGCLGHAKSGGTPEKPSSTSLLVSKKSDIAAPYHQLGTSNHRDAVDLPSNCSRKEPTHLLVKGQQAPIPDSKSAIQDDECQHAGKLSTHLVKHGQVVCDIKSQVSIGALSAAKKAIELNPVLRSYSPTRSNGVNVRKARPNSSCSRTAPTYTLSPRATPETGTSRTHTDLGHVSHNVDQPLSIRKITPLTGWTTVTSKRQRKGGLNTSKVGSSATHSISMVQVWEMIKIPAAVGRMWLRKNPQVLSALRIVVHHYGRMIVDLQVAGQTILHMVYIYSKSGEIMLPEDMTVADLLRDGLKSALYLMILATTFTVMIRIIRIMMFPLTVISWIVGLMTAGRGLSARKLA